MKINTADLTWFGRTFEHNDAHYFTYTDAGFEFTFTGKKAVATILSDADNWCQANKGWLEVFVIEGTAVNSRDFWEGVGEPAKHIILDKNIGEYTLFESENERTVKIRVIRQSEAAFGLSGLSKLEIDGIFIPPKSKDFSNKLKLEFIGDSITCGYGIDGVWEKDTFDTKIERPDLGYAYQTAKLLNAQINCVSWSGIGIISTYIDTSVNEPDNFWTMPALWPYTDKSGQLRLGLEPEVWNSKNYEPDIVVIHLGTNDASYTRGVSEREKIFLCDYRKLIEDVHRRSPNAKICCCLGVMGQDLCPQIEKAVELFKKEFPSVKIKTVTFPVQSESDGIAADWHPSAVTHKKMAVQLAKALENF